jgi:hypothetical protein
MKRIFHVAVGPGGMVAWNVDGKAVLISNPHFHLLVKELLADQDNGDQNLSMFAVRITQHMKLGNEADNDRLQELLDRRLRAKAESRQISFRYRFEDAEARKNVEDFLEAYKFNTGHAFYAVGRLHDGSDDVINISLRRKPSVLQKLRGVLGDPYREINILRSEITQLEGDSFVFVIGFRSGVRYSFGEDGVHEAPAI